ncbi:D-tagatose-bisphosphate aldolase, class II, non-catalytic subunit [Mycolicibacterium komossense]|uniref:D-tagatose-bisphosphate aldolase, class II, non-catalytic subunit n=1 Tax=Mycolicibacterium komossense TaxID=1779 RepID=A0ABT3CII1_9MYCO|nr:D-tagatose-bisphosphate aldolase, class II, non-catalytic subunit [Mycolicibacterium komossense]MCV7229252.1 D-tagatose-bisphosphate aldolase, class II, non-catalytic subunit [Mycolicibacterium komossense]
MTHPLDIVVHRGGGPHPGGVTSVCSAHPLVIEAALEQAKDGEHAVLIEATSNQVDQFGGYTGMRPADFRNLVEQIAHRVGFPVERIVLGGDHLGPNRWRELPAEVAMGHVDELVRSYVAAGYTKLHLDCSYPCADDEGPLTDDLVAARATRMLAVAEAEAARVGLTGRLRYVIGTEVPTPGGAAHHIDELAATTAEHARVTLDAHRKAFGRAGLDHVWPQVMALVVQPGVEFDHWRVVDYHREGTEDLRTALDDEPTMTFEAHSTDYQNPAALATLVADGWRVLKVGPGLTFAMREALFALAAIESEIVAPLECSNLSAVVERRMLASPEHWERYYPGSLQDRAIARRYSYSDRVRYYWADREIDDAVSVLLKNLSAQGIPEPMLSAYLPEQYERVRTGLITADPRALVIDRIAGVLRIYAQACAPHESLVGACR